MALTTRIRQKSRILAALLAMLTGLPPDAPWLARADSERNLPACCRRDGKHGCGRPAKGRARQTKGAPVKAGNTVCPLLPITGSSAPSPLFVILRTGGAGNAAPAAAVVAVRTQSLLQLSRGGAARKRGPPAARRA